MDRKQFVQVRRTNDQNGQIRRAHIGVDNRIMKKSGAVCLVTTHGGNELEN